MYDIMYDIKYDIKYDINGIHIKLDNKFISTLILIDCQKSKHDYHCILLQNVSKIVAHLKNAIIN
jgi:hypothetical protein